MKIGIICGNLDPKIGGGSSFCRFLLECLNKSSDWLDYKIKLFVKHRDHILHIKKFEKTLYKDKNLQKLLIKEECDLVWFMSGGGFPKPVDIPYFATIWDLQHRENPYLPEMQKNGEWYYREQMTAPFLLQAAKIFVGTKKGQEEITRNYGIPHSRICVLPLPAPPQHPEQIKKACQQRSTESFFFPAQFWAHKNHAILIQALKILKEKRVYVKLILPGDDKGNLAYIKSLVKKMQVDEMVEFPGFLSDEKICEFYTTVGALVFPSSVGPDNLPPLEALKYGCPVVQADLEGPREQLGDTVFYAPTFSAEKWAEYMENISTGKMKEECQRKKSLGLQLVQSRAPQKYLEKVLLEIAEFKKVISMWKSL